jgi:cyclopropane fatty-acyl-phospholipid synthase-like methyltransferase
MIEQSKTQSYFDAIYDAASDPWSFRTSAYEHAKYAATVAAVSDRHYQAGLEVGCSIGILSSRLAALCDDFLGVDISDRPLVEARYRCADLGWARFRQMAVPAEWPDGPFDLITLSEVLYFLSAADIVSLAHQVRRSLLPRGRVLLVNWLGAPETSQPGDWAATLFIKAAALPTATQVRQDLYRLDLLGV